MTRAFRGDRLRIRADEWNLAREAGRQLRDSRLDQRGGQVGVLPPQRFLNDSGFNIPRYGVGHVSSASRPGLATVTRPTTKCLVSLMVAAAPIADGKPGWGWTETGLIYPVRVTGWAALAAEDRVGTGVDSFDLCANPLGPFTILGKPTTPIVLALFTGDLGDWVYVDTGSATTRGPARSILWGIGYTPTKTTPGAPEVGS